MDMVVLGLGVKFTRCNSQEVRSTSLSFKRMQEVL